MLKGLIAGDIDFIGEEAELTVLGARLVDYMGASGLHLWNSVTNCLAPTTSVVGLQRSFAMLYPFHCTKYSSFPWRCQLSNICSTSYSSTPSHTMGGGGNAR